MDSSSQNPTNQPPIGNTDPLSAVPNTPVPPVNQAVEPVLPGAGSISIPPLDVVQPPVPTWQPPSPEPVQVQSGSVGAFVPSTQSVFPQTTDAVPNLVQVQTIQPSPTFMPTPPPSDPNLTVTTPESLNAALGMPASNFSPNSISVGPGLYTTEQAPTDLSNLGLNPYPSVNGSAQNTPSIPLNGPVVSAQPVTAVVSEGQAKKGLPKILIGVGLLVVLAAAGAAYFILGFGKLPDKSNGFVGEQQPLTKPSVVVKPTESPLSSGQTVNPVASAAAATPSAALPQASESSAIQRLRQRALNK